MNKLKANLDPSKDIQILSRLVSTTQQAIEIPATSSKTIEPQSSQSNSKATLTTSSIVIESIRQDNQNNSPRMKSKLKFTRLPAPQLESDDEADESDEEIFQSRASSSKGNSSFSTYSLSTPKTSLKRNINFDRSSSPTMKQRDELPSSAQSPHVSQNQIISFSEVINLLLDLT